VQQEEPKKNTMTSTSTERAQQMYKHKAYSDNGEYPIHVPALARRDDILSLHK